MKLSVTHYLVDKQLLTASSNIEIYVQKKTNFLRIFPSISFIFDFFSEMSLICSVSGDRQLSFSSMYAPVIIFTEKQNITM